MNKHFRSCTYVLLQIIKTFSTAQLTYKQVHLTYVVFVFALPFSTNTHLSRTQNGTKDSIFHLIATAIKKVIVIVVEVVSRILLGARKMGNCPICLYGPKHNTCCTFSTKITLQLYYSSEEIVMIAALLLLISQKSEIVSQNLSFIQVPQTQAFHMPYRLTTETMQPIIKDHSCNLKGHVPFRPPCLQGRVQGRNLQEIITMLR